MGQAAIGSVVGLLGFVTRQIIKDKLGPKNNPA
jgi:hypothetical protein